MNKKKHHTNNVFSLTRVRGSDDENRARTFAFQLIFVYCYNHAV